MSGHVLVTGGAGYIGSHACKALHHAGYAPVAYDNLVYGHRRAARWGPLEVGDIADKDRLGKVFQQYQPVAVLHFAAFAYVGESVNDPGKYYRNNVAGSLSLFEVMCSHEVKKIVFSSTCATYGYPVKIPISESHVQRPVSPYGASKHMVERILQDYAKAYGLRSISLRYFNAAGADPDGETGEAHDPETHLIPLVLDAIAGKRGPLTVFGDDYDTADGTCIRDYIHVTDLADAHLRALHMLDEHDGAGAYNLGNGTGFSVREVMEVAERVTGQAVPFRVGKRRAGDPAMLVADASRAIDGLGWQPKYAAMEDMVETAWRWTLSRQNQA